MHTKEALAGSRPSTHSMPLADPVYLCVCVCVCVRLIDEIATNPKVCKYIDMPLQHINNLVLLSMNRPSQDHTVKLLRKLRERIPGLVLRTTFISGFPGGLCVSVFVCACVRVCEHVSVRHVGGHAMLIGRW